MSYILDALKKSDKQRKHGTVPDPMTVHDTVEPKPKKHKNWPYLILFVFVLNAAILLWWLKPWQVSEQGNPVSTAGKLPAETVKTETSPAESPAEIAVIKSAEGMKRDASEEAPVIADASIRRERMIFSPLKSPDAEHPDDKPVTPVKDPVPDRNRVFEPDELPLSIQKDLPSLIITVHLYSEDQHSRMINTQGKTVKEGQMVADDLKLEQITPDSAIFSYKGYTFRKKLF
jgi:general secretion pathway protein B